MCNRGLATVFTARRTGSESRKHGSCGDARFRTTGSTSGDVRANGAQAGSRSPCRSIGWTLAMRNASRGLAQRDLTLIARSCHEAVPPAVTMRPARRAMLESPWPLPRGLCRDTSLDSAEPQVRPTAERSRRSAARRTKRREGGHVAAGSDGACATAACRPPTRRSPGRTPVRLGHGPCEAASPRRIVSRTARPEHAVNADAGRSSRRPSALGRDPGMPPRLRRACVLRPSRGRRSRRGGARRPCPGGRRSCRCRCRRA